MKTIGLIGGMSWESSAEYYRIINEETARRLGRFHSARCLMLSVDFAEIEALQHQDRWHELELRMVDAAQQLERGGADFLVLCTNTMHRMANAVERSVAIPFLHIADPTGRRIREAGITTVGLLATRFTMEQDFYRRRLEDRYGLAVLTPDADGRRIVHEIIYDELVHGDVRSSSRDVYRRAIDNLAERGAQGIILGCTEIMLLIGEHDSAVPIFDTTSLHAKAAVDFALAVDETASALKS